MFFRSRSSATPELPFSASDPADLAHSLGPPPPVVGRWRGGRAVVAAACQAKAYVAIARLGVLYVGAGCVGVAHLPARSQRWRRPVRSMAMPPSPSVSTVCTKMLKRQCDREEDLFILVSDTRRRSWAWGARKGARR